MRLPRLRTALLLLALCAPASHAADVLPAFEQVRAAWVASDAVLLDRHGEPLADVRRNLQARRLPWVGLQSLSPAMREALLAAEDKRFFEHSGIDWRAFIGAAWQNLWGTRRGASTLTMQLAGMLDPALHLPDRGRARRSVGQKWDQTLAALELERRWSKLQILEAYLNLAPFKGDLEGIGAASQILFGLAPEALTRREAVVLAALLRGPNAKAPIVTRRACALASALNDKRLCPAITRLIAARLNAPRNAPRYTLAPQLARSLLHEAGQQVRSTLEASQQRALLATLAQDKGPAWAMLLDNATGELRAAAWPAQTANAADPLSQTLDLPLWWAPFVAAHSLAERSHTAATLLLDGDNVLDARDARAGQRSQSLSLRSALAQRQSGALRSLRRDLTGDALTSAFNDLGIPPADTPGTSPQQLAIAWRALISASAAVPARGLPLEAPARRPQLIEAAFLLQDLLAQPAPQHSGPRSLWPLSSADGKTHLVIGNNDRHTLLLGLGAAAGTREPSDTLAQRSLQRWHEALNAIQKDPARPTPPPDTLISQIISFAPPDEAARREWFIKGTEFSPVTAASLPYAARIRWPQAGGRYPLTAHPIGPWALRADINRAVRWQLDGQLIGHGAQTSWPPQIGHHTLRLFGPRDEVLDALSFDVLP